MRVGGLDDRLDRGDVVSVGNADISQHDAMLPRRTDFEKAWPPLSSRLLKPLNFRRKIAGCGILDFRKRLARALAFETPKGR